MVVKKIVNFLARTVYFIIIIYLLLCIPHLFNCKPVIVLSGSMESILRKGSIIFYDNDNTNLKKGDIITYIVDDGCLVSHRIVNIEDDLIETKGDANNASDPYKVSREDVKGKVKNITIPYVGYFIGAINKNLAIIIPIFIIILILEFFVSNKDIPNINRERKE